MFDKVMNYAEYALTYEELEDILNTKEAALGLLLLGIFRAQNWLIIPIHSPSQPRGMTKQYAHTTRALALSLPTRGGGSDLQS